MLKISGNKIKLTRGDSAEITITVSGYDLQDGDAITLTVKKSTTVEDVILQKTASGGVVKFEPVDTKSLDYGDYVYDVQLTTADGDVYTVIAPSAFSVLEEVTW